MKRLFQPIEVILFVAVLVMPLVAFIVVGFAVERIPNEHRSYYPDAGIVTEIDSQAGIVVFRNSVGIEHSFFGDGYEPGDMCALIMDDMGTESDIYDDAVVDARYIGTAPDFH